MNRRILIVEDDPAIRMLVTAVLEDDGHEVHEVSDGLAALPAAQELRPDLVLLDIGLPGLDGFGVLAQLKAEADLRDVPVMMVTAWADPELVAKALDRGAHDYVRKPFDVRDLRERVSGALSGPSDRAALSRAIVARVDAEQPFSLVLVDCGFGEEPALVHAAARRLEQRVRGNDTFGHWSGSAFVVIADGATLGGAGVLAHDLCAVLSERPLDAPHGSRRVTCSAGVAQAAPGESADAVLARAGRALEQAGGDGVQLADALDPITA